jgi:hypothetical protein
MLSHKTEMDVVKIGLRWQGIDHWHWVGLRTLRFGDPTSTKLGFKLILTTDH